MAEAPTSDEITKLNARIKDLETELNREKRRKRDDDAESTSSNMSDSLGDVRDSQMDAMARVFRGLTVAAIEAARLTGDTVSNFAGDVIDRNKKRDNGKRTVGDLVWRLPEDLCDGLSTAIDDFARIPSKAADRYSSSYKEGTKDT